MKQEQHSLEKLMRTTGLVCGLVLGNIVNVKDRRNKFLNDISFSRTLFEYCARKLGVHRLTIANFLGISNIDERKLRRIQRSVDAEDWEFLANKVIQIYKKNIVYLAGKVSNSTYEHVLEKFQKAEEKLLAQGNFVINPTKIVPRTASWELAMRMLLPYLTFADAICLLPDWEDSEGAKMEYSIAEKLGLNVIFYKELDNAMATSN